jgi:hypothetical protein
MILQLGFFRAQPSLPDEKKMKENYPFNVMRTCEEGWKIRIRERESLHVFRKERERESR